MADGSVPAATMHIGEIAERTGLSLRTLRHYDEIGLLQPSGRTDGGFRLYTEDDLARLMVIRRMKPLGYSLAEMQEALIVIDAQQSGAGQDPPGAGLTALLEQARERRRHLQEQVEMADEFISLLTSYDRPHRQGGRGGRSGAL